MNDFLANYIDDRKEEMLGVLADFIAIESASDNKEKVDEALDFSLKLADSMGFRTENCLDGQVGVIEMGEGEEILGILAHVDVVPPGDEADWNTKPFEAVIKDGRMYGRGTVDDKGMILASLYAMKAVAEMNQPMKKKVQLILGTQEEVKWTDMDAYVKAYPLPDYGFSPDGEYPICNIEKGTYNFTMEFDVSADDAEGLHVVAIDCGIAKNAVPGKAAAVLSDGRIITATGKAVHSCLPHRGENALFNLCDMLKKMNVADNKLMSVLNIITDSFRSIYGMEIGLYDESEYYQGEYVHRNTFAPTIFKTDNGVLTVNINNRFAYGADEEAIVAKMTEFAENAGGKMAEVEQMPAVFVSKDSPFLSVFANAYEDVTGLKNEYTLAYGGSYAKAMPNIVSWGPLFPDEEDTSHEVNEYIDIENMMKSTKIFAESIAGIILNDKSFK